jgi:hypothetical protein
MINNLIIWVGIPLLFTLYAYVSISALRTAKKLREEIARNKAHRLNETLHQCPEHHGSTDVTGDTGDTGDLAPLLGVVAPEQAPKQASKKAPKQVKND